jgi:2-C-methyl-D-erythritol 4-phosphate cytidylyltransferase
MPGAPDRTVLTGLPGSLRAVPETPATRGPVWAVVVAAGAGRRFGGAKQYEPLAGARVLDHALRAARAVCDGVVLVVPPHRAADAEPDADSVVAGGETRSASVRAGLARVPEGAGVVVVHDGARPLAEPVLWERVVAAVRAGADAAVPVVPVTDTLRWTAGMAATRPPLDRDEVVAVQTPQAFAAPALRAAHRDDPEGTDDASLVEAAGGRVEIVPGDPRNLKVTDPSDLLVAEAVLCP